MSELKYLVSSIDINNVNNLQEIQDKLENKKFILKAPEKVVIQFKNQEQEIKSSIEKIEQIINTIK